MLPWTSEDLTLDEDRFSGRVRMFPLPDLVMFPHVMQKLHIFEERYQEMLHDALDSDGLIAMCVLAPGWEPDYAGRPAVLPYACLGRVVAHEKAAEGRYNILQLGLRRVRIHRELDAVRSFRQAEVELIEDVRYRDADEERPSVQTALTQLFQKNLPGGGNAESVRELLASDIPLGVLTDLISFSMPLSFDVKAQLLAEAIVDRRAEILIDELRSFNAAAIDDGSSDSSPFSVN
ncbi:MAG: LON peptidase substrate-binding domain-containing protein [Planctomycetota bacterium]